MADRLRQQQRHTERFRKVSNRYPHRVAEAYDGDLDRAMAESDEQVAATVAAWERRHGLPVRDWLAQAKRRDATVADDGDVERRLRPVEQAMEVMPPPAATVEERLTVLERAVHQALLDALYDRELARQRP